MIFSNHGKRWIAGLLVGALALATVAPAAEAGHGRGRGHGKYKYRYKEASSCAPSYSRAYPSTRYVVEHRYSSAGPAIAGFIGGLAVGTILAQNSRPIDSYPAEDYDFYDPYCHERYSSYSACRSHVQRCGGSRVVLVIDQDTGRCVDGYRYSGGRWSDYDYADYRGDYDGDDDRYYRGSCDDD